LSREEMGGSSGGDRAKIDEEVSVTMLQHILDPRL
jgi:hypothetical protein